MIRVVLALLIAISPVWAQQLHFAADRPLDVIHLQLVGGIDLEQQTFVGNARLDIKALRDVKTVRLDAVNLKVESVKLVGAEPGKSKALKFANTGQELQIELPRKLGRGTAFSLEIIYSVHKPEKGLYFFKPTEAEPKVPYQVWTQGETLEARHWIPITDQPNERLTSELVIACDPKYDVLSNGRKVVEKTTDSKKIVHWKQEKDHVPYLITLVVGKFAILKETWRGKELSYWVPPHRKGDAMRSFANTKRMMDLFSDRIGVEYPWAKYAQVVVEQFGWGGMENTSATTLNERTLHDERAHLDYSSDGLVAHELAHQWFGDLLTCKEWAHTWLNEGFATYFEALWAEHDRGEDAFRYNLRGKARGAINGGKSKPIVWRQYKGPWEQFDSRAYPKGAWVLHMVRRRLGDQDWWRAVNHYVTKHAHGVVETKDLRIAIEESTGHTFERFFHDWTARPGHPVVELSHRWIPGKNLMEVRVRQKQKSAAFHFPLRLEYHVRGTRLGIDLDVTEKDTRTMVPLPARPDLVRADPEYSVLMELTEKKARDWWQAQLQRDPDPIARIRAAEHFGGIKKAGDRKLLIGAFAKESFWGVQAEIATALGKSGGDLSRDALLAAIGTPHPKTRKAVIDALGTFRDDAKVRDALAAIVTKGDASYTVEAAAI
ncbi:MAG: M1 family aminopeptidase, partial [Planctomycetota bacterium]